MTKQLQRYIPWPSQEVLIRVKGTFHHDCDTVDAVPAGVWLHLVVSWQGDGTVPDIYWEGSAKTTNNAALPVAPGVHFRHPVGVTERLRSSVRADVGEYGVFDRALSGAEASSAYGGSLTSSGLLARYEFHAKERLYSP